MQTGHALTPWQEFPLSLVLVVTGEITVTVSGFANLPFYVHPDNKESPEAFKTTNPGGFLNSTCQLLSALLGTETSDHEPYTNIVDAQVGFHASTDVTVCVIPLTDFGGKHVPEDVRRPIVQALLKIYFIAFRYTKSHFSLHIEVLRCETQLDKLVNSVTISDGLSPAPLDLFRSSAFAAWLSTPDSSPGPDCPITTIRPSLSDRMSNGINAAANSFFCFSPSALSHTERKEKAFVFHLSSD